MPPPTFLFTDIEGSTALWERAPDAMKDALARHDRWLREAIASHDGRVVKTTGDGVMAVFDAPRDALRASVDAQRRLQVAGTGDASRSACAWGLHTGDADERDGDYFGAAPTRAARIMAAAYGGQVLVSAATAELLRAGGGENVALRELGEHRLKGLAAPERLSQVVAAGLRLEFPPLASQAGHSLPAERDAFVGRGDVLDQLRARFDAGARLVSVLAIGGAGKTRIVTHYGWSALGDHPGGVWFCDLTQARTPDGIVHAVAQGLDVALGKEDPLAQLGHAIAGRGRCLVILDNFEQVARHAAGTLGAWLDRAHAARFPRRDARIARAPGRAGDRRPSARPERGDRALPAPRASGPSDTDVRRRRRGRARAARRHARRIAARDRARGRAHRRDVAAHDAGPHVGAVSSCSRRRAGAPTDRQAALRANVRLVVGPPDACREVGARAAVVFEGGFTLDAAEAVVDVATLDDAWPADLVQSLLHKSLVRKGRRRAVRSPGQRARVRGGAARRPRRRGGDDRRGAASRDVLRGARPSGRSSRDPRSSSTTSWRRAAAPLREPIVRRRPDAGRRLGGVGIARAVSRGRRARNAGARDRRRRRRHAHPRPVSSPANPRSCSVHCRTRCPCSTGRSPMRAPPRTVGARARR
jgi:class 3 adenylate cyclase